MDLVLDRDIRNLQSFNQFSLYLLEKTQSNLDQVFFVIEERKEGFLISTQEDLDFMVSYCCSISNFYPRIIVQDEFIDFRIIEEFGNTLGTKIEVGQEFVKQWKIKCSESAKFYKIESGKWKDSFEFDNLGENLYLVRFKFKVHKKDGEIEIVARAVDFNTKCEFGPRLWIYFRT